MRCENCRDKLSLYIDNELDKDLAKEVKSHIDECDECKKEYEDIMTIKNMMNDLPQLELPKNFKDDLHKKLIETDIEDDMEVISLKNKKDKKKNKRRVNWKALSGIAAVLLIMVVSLSALGNLGPRMNSKEQAKQENMADDKAMEPMYTAEAPEMAPKIERDNRANNFEMSKADLEDSNEMDNGFIQQQEIKKVKVSVGRKVILNAFMDLEVEDYDEVYDRIVALIVSRGGFVQNSNTSYKHYNRQNPEKSLKAGEIVLRVPENDFYNIFNQIKDMGVVTNQRIDSKDITSQYRDTVNEVENLKVQEKRLRDIMTKAKNVKEILEVERELNRVRGQINIFTGQIKKWDDLVSLSTIEVYLNEIDIRDSEIKNIDDSIWAKSKKGFIRTTNRLIDFLERIFVTFISSLPILMLVGILILVAYFIIKKIIKILTRR